MIATTGRLTRCIFGLDLLPFTETFQMGSVVSAFIGFSHLMAQRGAELPRMLMSHRGGLKLRPTRQAAL